MFNSEITVHAEVKKRIRLILLQALKSLTVLLDSFNSLQTTESLSSYV